MNRDLYTAVRHDGLDEIGPLPGAVRDTLLREAIQGPPGTAVDIGCGKASALVPLATRGWTLLGLDRSEFMVDAARERLAALGAAERTEIRRGDARPIIEAMAPASVDGAICVGSTHVFGGLDPTVEAVRRIVRPGGWILLGDLYWRTPPGPGLLEALGLCAEDLADLATTFARPASSGLEPIACVAATEREFRDYESATDRAGRAWCAAHPTHPDAPGILARSEAWSRLLDRHGRGCLGFAAFAYVVR